MVQRAFAEIVGGAELGDARGVVPLSRDDASRRIDDGLATCPPVGAASRFYLIPIALYRSPFLTHGRNGSRASPPTTTDNGDGTYGPLKALPGETCYELKVHGLEGLRVCDSSVIPRVPGGEITPTQLIAYISPAKRPYQRAMNKYKCRHREG